MPQDTAESHFGSRKILRLRRWDLAASHDVPGGMPRDADPVGCHLLSGCQEVPSEFTSELPRESSMRPHEILRDEMGYPYEIFWC